MQAACTEAVSLCDDYKSIRSIQNISDAYHSRPCVNIIPIFLSKLPILCPHSRVDGCNLFVLSYNRRVAENIATSCITYSSLILCNGITTVCLFPALIIIIIIIIIDIDIITIIIIIIIGYRCSWYKRKVSRMSLCRVCKMDKCEYQWWKNCSQ